MPEAPAPSRPRGGKITQTFTTRIGPLPMWVWLVIIAGILIAWRIYSQKASAAQATEATGTDTSQVPADQVPQFVNQTYVSPVPPTSPGPAGPPGPTGPPGPGPGPNVVIPNVAGMTGAAAYQVLRSEALNPGPGGVKPTRKVIRTNPPAGSRVPKHTNVTVTFK